MNSSEDGKDQANHEDSASPPDQIKVVDRKGNVKVIPRSQYDAKRRRSKRRDASSRSLPIKEIIAVIFILAAIMAASYLALHLVK